MFLKKLFIILSILSSLLFADNCENLYNKKDYKRASITCMQQSKSGVKTANIYLGNMYYSGYGVKQNYKRAFQYYQKAAIYGNDMAQYQIGYMYFNGEGIEQDIVKAFNWFEKSANQNNDMAQYVLGNLYAKGIAVKQDNTKALEWYQKSASQDNTMAQKELEIINKSNVNTSIYVLLLPILLLLIIVITRFIKKDTKNLEKNNLQCEDENKMVKLEIQSQDNQLIIFEDHAYNYELTQQINSEITNTLGAVKTDDSIIDITNNYSVALPTYSDEKINNIFISNGITTEKAPEKFCAGVVAQQEIRLGDKYRKKLDLNSTQVEYLNKFRNTHVFLEIEGCCRATIELYLKIIEELENTYKSIEQNFINNILRIDEKIYALKEYECLKVENISLSLNTIFCRAEAAVRTAFEHKINISIDLPVWSFNIRQEFEESIGQFVNSIISKEILQIPAPDTKTEISLNQKNATRWISKFELIKSAYENKNEISFIISVTKLCELNKDNKNIDKIYHKIGTELGRYNQILPIQLYAHHIFLLYQKKVLTQISFTNKHIDSLPSYIRKYLNNSTKFEECKKIIINLLSNADCNQAFQRINDFFNEDRRISIKINSEKVRSEHYTTIGRLNPPLNEIQNTNLRKFSPKDQNVNKKAKANESFQSNKRKSIKIDMIAIKKTQTEDSSMIKLLSQYLEDDDTKTTNIEYVHHATNIDSENHQQKCLLNMTSLQLKIIEIFVKNQFTLPVCAVEEFARNNSVLSNALINSINELCYDYLDDNFIYQENETYLMEKECYDRIIQCK